MFRWFKKPENPQPITGDLTDEEITTLRRSVGNAVRQIEAGSPMVMQDRFALEAILIQTELLAQIKDQIVGLREDMAMYTNKQRVQ